MEVSTHNIEQIIGCYLTQGGMFPDLAAQAKKELEAIKTALNPKKEDGCLSFKFLVNVKRYSEKEYEVDAVDEDHAKEKAIAIAENDTSFDKEYVWYEAELPISD